jgi:hypothetical protein
MYWGCCFGATFSLCFLSSRSHVGEKTGGSSLQQYVHASKWGGKKAGKLSAAFHATLWSLCLEAILAFHVQRACKSYSSKIATHFFASEALFLCGLSSCSSFE